MIGPPPRHWLLDVASFPLNALAHPISEKKTPSWISYLIRIEIKMSALSPLNEVLCFRNTGFYRSVRVGPRKNKS